MGLLDETLDARENARADAAADDLMICALMLKKPTHRFVTTPLEETADYFRDQGFAVVQKASVTGEIYYEVYPMRSE